MMPLFSSLRQRNLLAVLCAALLLNIFLVSSTRADTPVLEVVGRLPIDGSLTGSANGVFVVDQLAYVAAGVSIWIVDVSDPSNLQLVAMLAARDCAEAIWVDDGFAYVADGDSGLTVIDVVDPSSAVIAGWIDTPGHAADVAVESGIAYMADGAGGVRAIDVGDPHLPAEVGSFPVALPYHLCLSDGLVYATASSSSATWARLDILSFSDPAAPVRLGYCSLSSLIDNNCISPKGLFVTGGYAYVSVWEWWYHVPEGWHYYDRLSIIDVANSSHPTIRKTFSARDPGSVWMSEGYAYLCRDNKEVLAIDVVPPEYPAMEGSVVLAGVPRDIFVSGDHAYLAAGDAGMIVLRLAPPGGYLIRGTVRNEAGQWIPDVTVELRGAAVETTLSGITGIYEFRHVQPGPHTVMALDRDLVFAPAVREYPSLGSDLVGQDFVGLARKQPVAHELADSNAASAAVGAEVPAEQVSAADGHFPGEVSPEPAAGGLRIVSTGDRHLRMALVPAQTGTVQFQVFTITGRLVWRAGLTANPAGEASVEWNGLDADGSQVAPGVYLVRATGAGLSDSRKVVFSR